MRVIRYADPAGQSGSTRSQDAACGVGTLRNHVLEESLF